MSTPFPVNAEITFPDGVVVRCYLKQARQGKEAEQGGETLSMNLRGRIDTVTINGVAQTPAALPPGLLPGTQGAIAITDLGGISGTINGEFYLEQSLDSAFAVSAALGSAIAGYMIRRVEWIDPL